PNQAVSVKSQIKINERRNQTPPLRKVRDIILKKSRSLVRKLTSFDKKYLNRAGERLRLLTRDSAATPELADGTVRLVVTSPPFLNVVDYAVDNWLRCWFIGVDADRVPITMLPRLEDWTEKMRQVFLELHRLLTPGGWVAFEVGEVNKGTVRLEEYVIPAAHAAGLRPVLVLINSQTFTKTANCWGVSNNSLGTNTNRIVLLGKE
ncbi:site-specific DNA-methyltransferase, partial [bacterium]|nr:site-specific DNA-methyltransferase [candidate division CSSED10-310 bacterium]